MVEGDDDVKREEESQEEGEEHEEDNWVREVDESIRWKEKENQEQIKTRKWW